MVPEPRLPVKLACICGACQLSSAAAPLKVYLCHCLSCQRVSGSDYCHNARFEPGQVKVDKGSDQLTAVKLPGSQLRYHYCNTCRIRVYIERLAPEDASHITRTVVPVGLVTSRESAAEVAWQPEGGHGWYPERARDVLDNRPKWEGFCGDSEQLSDAAPSVPAADSLPQPQLPVTVSCRCGASQLEATAPPLAVYYCHCASCQQMTGSDFAHNAQFEPDQLRVVKGEEDLKQYTKPGSPRTTFYCGHCSGRMYRQAAHADGTIFKKVVPVGLVDKAAGAADPAWQPRYHIWWSERAVQDLQDGLPKWSGGKDTSELVVDIAAASA